MTVRLLTSLALLLLVNAALAQDEQKPDPKYAVADPAVAAEDPDFRLQGEFLGRIRTDDGRLRYTGLQVVALGNGKFDAVHYAGGLPGAGWNRSDKTPLSGERTDGTIAFTAEDGRVVVTENDARFYDAKGRRRGTISRIDRVSPTLGSRPPGQATVLFDGTGTEHFKGGQTTEDGLLRMGTEFAEAFGDDFTLHLEYRLPYMPHARGQGRANSGVYLNSRYEVQILDSFGLEGVENEAAALYKQRRPDVNMALPPLRWQTYDITFVAPRFDEQGEKVRNARITVLHNGVPVHDDVEVTNKTGAGKPEGPEPLPTKLQNHGNPVVFRNIWIVEHDAVPCCRCCRR